MTGLTNLPLLKQQGIKETSILKLLIVFTNFLQKETELLHKNFYEYKIILIFEVEIKNTHAAFLKIDSIHF